MLIKIIKKLLLVTIILFMLPVPVKAAHPVYSYDTAGEYRWYKNGNYLVNDVDAYKDKKLTKLSIFYNNPKNGVMYTGDEDFIGKDNKLGNFTVYTLASTSNDQNSSDFSVNGVGTYYVLFNEDTKKVSDIVHIPDPLPYAYVNRYKFWIGGDETKKVYFLHSEGGGDNWYGDYLARIGKDVKDKKPGLTTVSNPPQPPAASGAPASGLTTSNTTGTTATSTGSTTGCQNDPTCPPPHTPATVQILPVKHTVSESLKQGNIATAWALSLDVVNVLAIFMLLAIAFANILHIGEREMFSFKRMIPAFVIGLILANFSHLICRAIIDFAGMLMNFFVPKEQAANVVYNIYIGMFGGWTGAAVMGAAGIGGFVLIFFPLTTLAGCGIIILATLILGFPIVITAVLWFLLAIRTYILWLLVILSPIAFFGMFFDPLKKTIGMWWTWFLKWTFMGPIAYFFIYLAEGFARDTSTNNSVAGCIDLSNADQVGGFTKYLIVNALLIMAIYIPYVLGDKLMAGWAGFGKFLGGMGLWAGAGTGAAGARLIGQHTPLKALKKIQSPVTLPALPKGWENSGTGMLWQKIREADTSATMRRIRGGISGNEFLGGLTEELDDEAAMQGMNDASRGPWRGLLGATGPRHIAQMKLKAASVKPIEDEEARRQVAWATQKFNEEMKVGVDFDKVHALQKRIPEIQPKIDAGTASRAEKAEFKEYNESRKQMFSFSDIYNPSTNFRKIQDKAKEAGLKPKLVKEAFKKMQEQISNDDYWNRISDSSRTDAVDIHALFMNPDALPTRRSRTI